MPESLEDALVWSLACRCENPARWKEAEKRVESFTQIIGPTAVEYEVREAVTALQALGVGTFASCGGHLDPNDLRACD